ncbi:cobalamin biosynthesis protein CobD [Alicyclobacillus sacchari]|uniref:adenosylcobinamide-phosphate synthase CbiB n=1 Tax=Alicyclobacillus sacchari TaxID=392010 RepID=UPI0023E98A4D|nr:adenosylcobinamide-phosphate synthase CbiB [Alicyclobacillus sacchari]GMA55602.1 cobalamin biosynthesis protein CobD [Alicyclobacillus sacchari]
MHVILIHIFVAAAALAVDRLVGDPQWIPHPVVAIGRFIQWFEKHFYRVGAAPWQQRLVGFALTLSTTVLACGTTWCVVTVCSKISSWLGLAINIWICSTTIAWKGLRDAGRAVSCELVEHGLDSARTAVSRIVGRDTDHLSEAEVVRATVETVAENLVDAVVSPVLFTLIGGATLAILYRAANTLDSMVGYRSERYRWFGFASARFDDVLNYVLTRVATSLLSGAIACTQGDLRGAWRALVRDARKHPSPNSGIPEAMVAGALGVQLGGLNYYGGIPSHRATMGEARRPCVRRDIERSVRILDAACWMLTGALVTAMLVMILIARTGRG